MSPVAIVSIFAGAASLAAGIATRLLSGLHEQEKVRDVRPSRRAELKAQGKDLKLSAEFGERVLRRLKILLLVAFVYFSIGAFQIFLPEKAMDGWQTRVLYFAAIVVSVLAAGVMVITILEFYSRINKNQQKMERKIEEINQLVRR
jgi:hypothetical protein